MTVHKLSGHSIMGESVRVDGPGQSVLCLPGHMGSRSQFSTTQPMVEAKKKKTVVEGISEKGEIHRRSMK